MVTRSHVPSGFFSLRGLLRLDGSVTIRGVSTKLKVNSGRTSPTVNLPTGRNIRKKRDRPLDGFQVNLATTLPLNESKGRCEEHLL
jgi:hypothetical protein